MSEQMSRTVDPMSMGKFGFSRAGVMCAVRSDFKPNIFTGQNLNRMPRTRREFNDAFAAGLPGG